LREDSTNASQPATEYAFTIRSMLLSSLIAQIPAAAQSSLLQTAARMSSAASSKLEAVERTRVTSYCAASRNWPRVRSVRSATTAPTPIVSPSPLRTG
jgi:hypothetical protein